MSKYLADQASAREAIRNRLIGNRALPINAPPAQAASVQPPPENSNGLMAILQALQETMAPKGIKPTESPALQVAPSMGTHGGGGGGGGYEGGDSGGGGALGDLLKNLGGKPGQAPADVSHGTTGAHTRDAARRGQTPGPYATGPAATQWAREQIPGLKPGIDASKAPPGTPAAQAYLEQQKPGGGVVGVEKGVRTEGYQSDLDYLNQHGGHATVMKDGAKVNVPLGTKGNYGDINPELAARLRAGGELYEKETGKAPTFGESSRGDDVQKTYWEDSAHGTKYAAARPQSEGGRGSEHLRGNAMDLPGDFQQWMHKNGDRVGVHFPVANDAPHAQVNPSFNQTLAKPGGPSAAVPAWDKGLPQKTADTQWPSPTATSTRAEVPTPQPGTAQPPATDGTVTQPSTTGGNAWLGQQRAQIMSEIDRDPKLRSAIAWTISHETDNVEGATGVVETMVNRAMKNGDTSLWKTLDSGFYGPVNRAGGAKAVSNMANNPGVIKQADNAISAVRGGSNITDFRDDQGTNAQGQPEIPAGGSGVAKIGGEHMYYSGADAVAWANKMRQGMGGSGATATAAAPATPAPPAEKPGVPGFETASETMKQRADAAPVARETPLTETTTPPPAPGAAATTQAAVPYAGRGGLESDVGYAGTAPTMPTTAGPGGEALNKIQPNAPAPVASAPAAAAAVVPPRPPVVAAAAAPPPPPPRAAPPPPVKVASAAPTPPLTPAAVAQKHSGLELARANIDTPIEQIAMERGGQQAVDQVGWVARGKTPRQLAQSFGGMFMNKAEPLFESLGITRQDFEAAAKLPPAKQDIKMRFADGLKPPASGARPTGNLSPFAGFRPEPGSIDDRRNTSGEGQRMMGRRLGMAPTNQGESWPPAGETSPDSPLAKAGGAQDIGKPVGAEDAVSSFLRRTFGPAAGAIEGIKRPGYSADDPNALPGSGGIRGLMDPQQAQAPQAPTISPEMAKVLETIFNKPADHGPPLAPQPDAQPVMPATDPGGANPLPLAPPGLTNAPTAGPSIQGTAPMQMVQASQGSPTAMAGLMPIPPSQGFSTPSANMPGGAGVSAGLSPISPEYQSWETPTYGASFSMPMDL